LPDCCPATSASTPWCFLGCKDNRKQAQPGFPVRPAPQSFHCNQYPQMERNDAIWPAICHCHSHGACGKSSVVKTVGDHLAQSEALLALEIR